MQMTLYLVIVYLLMHGLVSNYRAMATEELGAHSSHDMPQVEGPAAGQASSSEHTKASAERLKKLESERVSLVDQLNTVKAQSKGPDRTKAMQAFRHQIRRRRREIQAITMGLPAIPRNLIDKSHLPGLRQKNKPKESLRIQQAQNVEDLRRQRDSEQNPKRRRLLQVQLTEARRRLKEGKYEDAVVENMKAGGNPAELVGLGYKGRKACAEKLAEMEMEFDQEESKRRKKNLRARILRLKNKINVATEKAKQDGSCEEGKSANEKVDELQLGAEKASHIVKNLKSDGELPAEQAFQEDIESNGGGFDRFMQDLCAGDDSDGQDGIGNWDEPNIEDMFHQFG